MIEKKCIILLVNLLFYFKTLKYQYVSDDIPSSQRKETHPKWKYWLLVFEGHLKSTPLIDHGITMILHSLVCVFIYTAFGANEVSFIGALLFSLNPINNQGSVWISGRGYVFSALGMLMAMTFPYISPIFLLGATYSNAGFFAPIALSGSQFSWMLLFMPLVWLFHWGRFKKNVGEKIKQEMYEEDKKVSVKKLILLIKTASFYFVHSILPIKNTFYHSYMQSMAGSGRFKAYSLKDRFLWIGIAIIVGIFWYWITHPWDMISFGFLWWIITIAPFCNLFRLHQEIAERYCYLPNVGLMIVLSSIIIKFPILIPIFLTMYATKMWFWMEAYRDDYLLVEHSIVASPGSWFAWHVKAIRKFEQQSYQEALTLWTMAKLLSPNELKVLFNLATTLRMGGHTKEANQFMEMAKNNVPPGQEAATEKLCKDWETKNFVIL